ncbi:hypothetical protein E2K80_01315 [Rhodophyticola sp. CCM32]|uniref:hypothetical protein n=1 Tax=Rhodophyticola sp. CCM32 TaxID=2916397 RepID=UPI00107FC8C5|nr:hypothetical protein [Rhodophyticola sp. CCM32]QBX99531.1 hypothetical protein E2K80_01315 [Rhodophyticola sp. CCM32]
MDTNAIQKYEEKIAAHDGTKARLTENLAKQAEPKDTFEEKLEPALLFLANPWKLWESPSLHRTQLRRLVPKLTFAERLKYYRNQGARNPGISFTLKGLLESSQDEVLYGAPQGSDLEPELIAECLSEFEDWADIIQDDDALVEQLNALPPVSRFC